MPLGREVDLAREERIRKCDTCIEQFEKFSKSKGYQKALQREGETVLRRSSFHLQRKIGRKFKKGKMVGKEDFRIGIDL